MKVLFVTGKEADYMSCVLWDGLNEVLGSGNMVDAVNNPFLHPDSGLPRGTVTSIGFHPTATGNVLGDQGDFDVMVLNAAVRRDYSWDWVEALYRERMIPGAKVLYVNGMDDSDQWGEYPPFAIHAMFRREMHPDYPYHGNTFPMLLALPERNFRGIDNDRYLDVFYGCSISPAMPPQVQECRWACGRRIYETAKMSRALVALNARVPFDDFTSLLHHSRLGVCPVGTGSDCNRQWETVAMGTIPILVGHPPRVRDPWFAPDEVFWLDHADQLPGLLDDVLDRDLEPMRIRLRERALSQHTTRARAERLLGVL